MGKVSIGLRGWRFNESDVFDTEGNFKSLDEMPADTRNRLLRLTALIDSPCDACWILHGDEHLDRCRPARVVYGEPQSEIVLCTIHEPDFIYWFRDEGGNEYRGEAILQDAFIEWFEHGGRAPDDYTGLEHVETAPETLPDPRIPDDTAPDALLPRDRIDLRSLKPDS